MDRQFYVKATRERGQAALITVILLLFSMLAMIAATAAIALRTSQIAKLDVTSGQSYFLAESGTADALYRLMRGKTVSDSYSLSLSGSQTTITINTVPGGRDIISSASASGLTRAIKSSVKTGVGASFYYGVQVDAGGVAMGNGAQINGNIFSNGSIDGGRVTGNATVAAGTNNKIANITVDGTARAPAFVNVSAGGSACPNANCVVASDQMQPLPISDGLIQDWRNEAVAAETINGNYTVSGSKSLGPTKISGNLKVSGGSTLTVTGTIWVTGTFETENNTSVNLDSSYGANSGIIVTDDVVSVSNNTTISGSGQTGSYLMIISAKNAPTSQVIDISNNSLGAIFYANHGRIHFNNNAAASEVTGYGFDLDNNAGVTYQTGLQNINFSSGPSGGWLIDGWQEIVP